MKQRTCIPLPGTFADVSADWGFGGAAAAVFGASLVVNATAFQRCFAANGEAVPRQRSL